MLEGLADFIIVIDVSPGTLKALPGIVDGIHGQLEGRVCRHGMRSCGWRLQGITSRCNVRTVAAFLQQDPGGDGTGRRRLKRNKQTVGADNGEESWQEKKSRRVHILERSRIKRPKTDSADNQLYSMKRTISGILLLAAISGTAAAADNAAQNGRIRVSIANLRSSDGIVGIALFNTGSGFPDKPERAVMGRSVSAGSKCEVVFDKVPYGTYAVSVLHDENGNRKMDKTFIGIPREGFGTSNNPKIRRGAPSFGESRFSLAGSEVALRINMNYFNERSIPRQQ